MGRKRKDAVKVNLMLRVDPILLQDLNDFGVNKSELFDKAARDFLKNNKEDNVILGNIDKK